MSMKNDPGIVASDSDARTSVLDAAELQAAIGPYGHAALHLSRSYQAYIDAAAASQGIPGAHVPVLSYLLEGGDGHTQNDIAHAVGLDKGTVSRRIAQLVRLDLVSQVTSERDSRAHSVRLTERGRALAETIAVIPRRWNLHVTDGMTEASRVRLLDDLNDMIARAEELLVETLVRRESEPTPPTAL
jgi:DNA-binding MarR family transcriptional regulator